VQYFTHISQFGPLKYDLVLRWIGVLEALDKFMPIGEASCRTHDENGLAVWTLRIGKQEIAGRRIVLDRESLVNRPPSTCWRWQSYYLARQVTCGILCMLLACLHHAVCKRPGVRFPDPYAVPRWRTGRRLLLYEWYHGNSI
jgi:hypothetical protein